jgi:hypothetical protein
VLEEMCQLCTWVPEQRRLTAYNKLLTMRGLARMTPLLRQSQ